MMSSETFAPASNPGLSADAQHCSYLETGSAMTISNPASFTRCRPRAGSRGPRSVTAAKGAGRKFRRAWRLTLRQYDAMAGGSPDYFLAQSASIKSHAFLTPPLILPPSLVLEIRSPSLFATCIWLSRAKPCSM
jgi:hypothetical protein